jgi:hypothetical protein
MARTPRRQVAGTTYTETSTKLYTELLERTPSLSEKMPPGFPSRTLLFKASVETIHNRAEYFHKYLHVLNHDPHLANAYPMLSFLELNAVVQCLAVVCRGN